MLRTKLPYLDSLKGTDCSTHFIICLFPYFFFFFFWGGGLFLIMSTGIVCPHPLIPAFVENEYFYTNWAWIILQFSLYSSKKQTKVVLPTKAAMCWFNPEPSISCLWVFIESFNPSVFEVYVLTFNPLSPSIYIQILQTDLYTFP